MKIFIGSSTEGLDKAKYIKNALREFHQDPILWNSSSNFVAGHITINSILSLATTFDAAIFIFTPDDLVKSREQDVALPRDNVIFEFGIFAQAIGIIRTIICRFGDVKVASDLQGITVINWQNNEDSVEQLRTWCNELESQPIVENDVLFHCFGGLKNALVTDFIFQDFSLGNFKINPENKEYMQDRENINFVSYLWAHATIDGNSKISAELIHDTELKEHNNFLQIDFTNNSAFSSNIAIRPRGEMAVKTSQRC